MPLAHMLGTTHATKDGEITRVTVTNGRDQYALSRHRGYPHAFTLQGRNGPGTHHLYFRLPENLLDLEDTGLPDIDQAQAIADAIKRRTGTIVDLAAIPYYPVEDTAIPHGANLAEYLLPPDQADTLYGLTITRDGSTPAIETSTIDDLITATAAQAPLPNLLVTNDALGAAFYPTRLHVLKHYDPAAQQPLTCTHPFRKAITLLTRLQDVNWEDTLLHTERATHQAAAELAHTLTPNEHDTFRTCLHNHGLNPTRVYLDALAPAAQ